MQDLFNVATAGLLHDVGKFFDKLGMRKLLDCSYNHEYHHYLSACIIDEALKDVKDETRKKNLEEIRSLVIAHHPKQGDNWSEDNPYYKEAKEKYEKKLEALIFGDHASSGQRIYEEKTDSKEKSRILIPIALKPESKKDEKMLWSYRSYFFSSNSPNLDVSYERISKEFRDHLINLLKQYEPNNKWLLKLIILLKIFTFFVNSYQQSKTPEISLFTHSLLTSAIATNKYLDNEMCFLSLKIGSIQKFITGVEDKDFTGKFGAKLLRGRSDFIKKKIFEITETLLEKVNLPFSLVLVLVSGKALLLIPKSKVEEIRKYLNRDIISFNKNEYPLTFSFGFSDSFGSKEDFKLKKEDEDSILYRCIGQSIMRANLNLYAKKKLDSNINFSKKLDICKFCGEISELKECTINDEKEEMCGKCCFLIRGLKKKNPLDMEIFKLDLLDTLIKNPLLNDIYVKKENLQQNLEELVKTGKSKEDKYSYLAFVSLDLDKMGERIKNTIKEGSLSKYLELALFIKRYLAVALNNILRKNNIKIYLLYLGGDDLTFMAKPKDAFKILKELYKAFEYISTEEDKITFTASYTLVKRGVPISSVLEKGESLLKQGKNKERGKTYFSFMKKGINSIENSELEEFSKYLRKLEEWDLNKTFLYNILNIYYGSNVRFSKKSKRILELITEGKTYYVVNKNIKLEEIREFLLNLFNKGKLIPLIYLYLLFDKGGKNGSIQ